MCPELQYGAGVDNALAEMRYRNQTGKPWTKELRVLYILLDGEFHDGTELARKVSHRFGGYLHTLKKKGVEWECVPNPSAPKGERWFLYRLLPADKQTRLL